MNLQSWRFASDIWHVCIQIEAGLIIFFPGETCKGPCSNAEADNKCHQDRSLRFGLGPGRPCNPYDDQEFVDKYFKLSAHQQTLSIFDGPSGYILYFWAFPRWKETTKWSDKEVWFDCIVNLWYCKLCVFIKIKLRSAVRSNLFYQAEILNSVWCSASILTGPCLKCCIWLKELVHWGKTVVNHTFSQSPFNHVWIMGFKDKFSYWVKY